MVELHSDDDDSAEREGTKRFLVPRAPHATRRLRLVVMLPVPATFPLPERGTITIGRARECEVRVDDQRLSRVHAELRLSERIELVDRGSVNGTKVGGRALAPNEPHVIAPGELLQFGALSAVLHATSPSTQLRHVSTHAHFEARLQDECTRAAHGKGPFAVIRVHVDAAAATTFEVMFERWMRPMDSVALYAPNEYEFLFPDLDRERAAAVADAMRAHLPNHELAIGIACYPSDGRTRERLVAASGPRRRGDAPEAPPSPTGAIEQMRPVLERVAAGTISVLVTGETGAGKEVVAHAIHSLSPRSKAPLVCVNCAALSEHLLESELFGHERGAFTGATQAKQGLLESANGGTVFLDEVGEMPLALQVKLLRVIEQKEVARVGALKPIALDVRFIAATNRDLEAEMGSGTFRQDLYFRLNGVQVVVPPLRERRTEVERIAGEFASRFADQLGRPAPRIAPDVVELFQRYAWPGNVRELRNVIERAVLMCAGGVITLDDVPRERMDRTTSARPSTASTTDEFEAPSSRSAVDGDERTRVIAALERCAGNQTQAAKLLGISRGTLIARLDQYGVGRPRKR